MDRQHFHALVNLAILVLRLYRLTIGTIIPTRCVYYPSCSNYAETAIKNHGLVAGARMAILRVLRCHPLHRGGFDPVP